MMGNVPEAPCPPHLYPEAIQLKLYQAFIFSIPILFSIILFLLFYLFYLKKRAFNLSSSSSSSSPPTSILPTTTTYLSSPPAPCQFGFKGEVKDYFPVILFDEQQKTRDSQCCVCLGDFEIEEELLQLTLCKHVFHIECIQHWLRSNSTCPLCRCSVIPITTTTTKLQFDLTPPPPPTILALPDLPHSNSYQHHRDNISMEQQQQQQQQSMLVA